MRQSTSSTLGPDLAPVSAAAAAAVVACVVDIGFALKNDYIEMTLLALLRTRCPLVHSVLPSMASLTWSISIMSIKLP